MGRPGRVATDRTSAVKAAILADSDEREDDPVDSGGIEHRTSAEATDPLD